MQLFWNILEYISEAMPLGFGKGLRDHMWNLVADYFRGGMMTIARQALCKTVI